MQKINVSEATLRTDYKELAQNLTRELAVACKKVSIYGAHHPQTTKALEKPFLLLGRTLTYKKHVNYRLQRGQLSLLNIQLADTIFNTHLIQFMQAYDITALVFKRGLSAHEFTQFVHQFASIERYGETIKGLHNYLKVKKIENIELNSELGLEFFEHHKQYRDDVHGDFTLRRFCLDQLPSKLDQLIDIANLDETELERQFIDFSPEVVRYVLPEKISAIPFDSVRGELQAYSTQIRNATSEEERSTRTAQLIEMIGLLRCHADHAAVIKQFEPEIKEQFEQFAEMGHPGSATGRIRMELRQQMDQLLTRHFSQPVENCPAIELAEAYLRLTKTGQHQHAQEVLEFLIERLSDTDAHYRQHALEILIDIVHRFVFPAHYRLAQSVCESIARRVNDRDETYEYSDLVGELFRRCLDGRNYKLILTLTTALSSRKTQIDGVNVIDSLGIKKALDNINFERGVRTLVDEMVEGTNEGSDDLRLILTHIGSEEVAIALSEVISHPKRIVRQQSLKILAELGKPALDVFTRMLMDDSLFEREPGRHEIPDSQWYIIRNSVFVLGSLKDERGIPPLRLRMSDKDVRVRREIVDALEKIGGDEAIDLLIVMAEDSVNEIAEKALRTVGLIGHEETVPLLIDLAERIPAHANIALWGMGKIGGEYAYDYLSKLLDDSEKINQLSGGRMSREEVRLAVIKALVLTGDKRVKETVKDFSDTLGRTQKLFFKNSPLQKVISEILEK